MQSNSNLQQHLRKSPHSMKFHCIQIETTNYTLSRSKVLERKFVKNLIITRRKRKKLCQVGNKVILDSLRSVLTGAKPSASFIF